MLIFAVVFLLSTWLMAPQPDGTRLQAGTRRPRSPRAHQPRVIRAAWIR